MQYLPAAASLLQKKKKFEVDDVRLEAVSIQYGQYINRVYFSGGSVDFAGS